MQCGIASFCCNLLCKSCCSIPSFGPSYRCHCRLQSSNSSWFQLSKGLSFRCFVTWLLEKIYFPWHENSFHQVSYYSWFLCILSETMNYPHQKLRVHLDLSLSFFFFKTIWIYPSSLRYCYSSGKTISICLVQMCYPPLPICWHVCKDLNASSFPLFRQTKSKWKLHIYRVVLSKLIDC